LPDGLPPADPAALRGALEAVRDAVRAGRVRSAHDVAEGGLAVALAECCLAGGLGACVALDGGGDPLDELLFGEGPGGFVVSGPRQALEALGGTVVGDVTDGDALELTAADAVLAWSLADLRAARERGLAERMGP
jgi:phosphoribosylformylglycinamidine (FGAM) synthase-like enzyme